MEIPNALSIALAWNLSKRDYVAMQKYMSEEHNINYPDYELLEQETINCCPNAEDLTITERSAKIKLQSLMDLTSKRLVSAIDTSPVETNQQLILTSQWGFDRSSSHSICYNESFYRDNDCELVYNFMICVVPLSLVSNNVTIWQNERPSSLSFCRPILFKFMKDTKENVQAELATIKAEIEALFPTTLVNGMTVTHLMKLRMIDDEYQPITKHTIASVCQICKAKAIKTNPHLQLVNWTKNKQANKDEYGLSSLHAWTRAMESLLEISYRLDNKSWQANSNDAICKLVLRKVKIELNLSRNSFALQPRQQMQESAMYKGRSARVFFEDTKYFSNLTNIDSKLFRRICVILQIISSGRKIIAPKFREYCVDTAKRYMELYPWYNMPSPLHKLLIHGPDFVENMTIIPIGMLCEELTEHIDTKFIRNCREENNFSKVSMIEEHFASLLLTSDPNLAIITPRVNNSVFKEFNDLTENI